MTDFSTLLKPDLGDSARTLYVVAQGELDAWLATQPAATRALVMAARPSTSGGTPIVFPEGVGWSALIVTDPRGPWFLARAAEVLPEGSYRVEGAIIGRGALGWLLAQHCFDRYRRDPEPHGARVLLTSVPTSIDPVVREAAAIALVRDLVDTPAADMGPPHLEAEVARAAADFDARLTVTRGGELAHGYPMIHAVGQAASRDFAPRLIELEWGSPAHPRVAIVGKGVCFDSGGLDIKPSSGMRLMKKDMGGAAHAIALARLVMGARLPVRLHLLIPAVENAIAGNAFRPGDVLTSRAGLSVEIGNTDAEGRLVLADALTKAGESDPALIIDFATLTGAARVALGPDLPALFGSDDALTADMLAAGLATDDPVWRLPLYDGYDETLKSDIADLTNAPEGGFAGAVTAALFLRRFVTEGTPWLHLDTFAWRPAAKSGRPKGGAALGLSAAWAMLAARFVR